MKRPIEFFSDVLDKISRNKKKWILIFVIALATRSVGAIIGGKGGNRGDDDGMLLGIALNFLNGKGFSMYWEGLGPLYCFEPPGLPFFHLIFICLFKNYLLAERIFFVLMSSVTAVIFGWLSELYFKPRTAFLLSLIFVLYPAQWFWSTRINGHTYATNMLVIALYLLFVLWSKPSWWLAVLIGFLWSTMSFMRPEYMLGIFCLAAGSYLKLRTPHPSFLKIPTLLIVGWMVGMSPWAIRNYLKVGRPVLSSNHYSYNFWMVFNDQYAYGGKNFPTPPDLLARLKNATEIEQVDIWVAEGLKYIKDDHTRAVKRVLTNLANFWRPWLSFSDVPLKENLLYIFTWIPIFILFLVGLFKIPWSEPEWFVVWSFGLYKMLAQIPFYMIVRFREAIFPLFLLIAGLALQILVEKRSSEPFS